MENTKRKKTIKKRRRCDTCNQLKADVYERPNRYAREIGEREGATHVVCDDCDRENALSI